MSWIEGAGAFLVIDKPPGITSHDVVAAVRAVTGIKKVGHTGTLDPFATGVLPLALGAATRLIQFLDESIKVYDATIQLGTATDTGDPTGDAIRTVPVPELSSAEIEAVLAGFLGDRMQRPPAYSAVKVRGKPMYSYARKGEAVEAAARPVTIHALELIGHEGDQVRVLITCSRGTYARVLADEIAVALGTAGHLVALIRPRSGPFFLENSLSMPRLAELVAEAPEVDWHAVLLSRGKRPAVERIPWRPRDTVREALAPWLRRPLEVLSHLSLADVGEEGARRVRSGGAPPPPPGVAAGGRYLVVSGADLVAVAEATATGGRILKTVGQ